TSKSIKNILSYALSHSTGPTKVARVVFRASPGSDPTADHYVEHPTIPGNPTSDVEIAALVDTTGTLLINLICPGSLPNKSSPTPNTNADLDVDDDGNIIEQPPIKIFTPQDLSPPKLKKKKMPKPKKKKVAKKKK